MKNIKYLGIIVFVGVLAWYRTLDFWFFKGYEATWLTGLTPFTILNLLRGHAILYFVDYKIFGWMPMGWYATSLLLHLVASILLFYLVSLLTKNKILSFISSLIFVASTAYNDVLTWGSFNSYYPLLLIFLLLCLITYHKFKKSKKLIYLFISLLFSFLGFFTRETGIVIIPLLLAYELSFSEKLKSKKTWIQIIKNLSPFALILVIFFLIRSIYGGTSGDSADSNVKLQMRLVEDGLYVEYAEAALLTLGKLIPPQIIPYPLLNVLKQILSSIFNPVFISNYFFPALGWVFLMGLSLIAYVLRKNKKYFRIFVLSFLWLLAFSLFVSLAVPNTNEVLIRDYEWNTMRYRYFAFIGTSIMLSVLALLGNELIKKRFSPQKSRILFPSAIFLFVAINLLLIWRIEAEIYKTAYKPQKEFYATFKKFFPTLPKDAVFYLYPTAPGLSDYMLEWYLIKEGTYPNLIEEPYRVESQLIAVLDKAKKGKIDMSQVFFLDYDIRNGLQNKTKEVNEIIKSQQKYSLNLKKTQSSAFESGEIKGPKVEFPYNLEISLTSVFDYQFVGSSPDSNKFKALVDYNVQRKIYLDTTVIKTTYTASQREGEPFFHTLSEHLTDGNIGPRSSWRADTFNPIVEVDLGGTQDVAGVIWGSQVGTRSPATYSFFVSMDRENWDKVKSVKNSKTIDAIDFFDKPVKARYVKMEIYTTAGGDFVLLDEFEVLNSKQARMQEFYKSREELLKDSNEMFKFVSSVQDLQYIKDAGLNHYFGKLTWETNKTSSAANYQTLYFPFGINLADQSISIKIPESEVFAGTGEFLQKHITSMVLDFGSTPFIIDINSAMIMPRKIYR